MCKCLLVVCWLLVWSYCFHCRTRIITIMGCGNSKDSVNELNGESHEAPAAASTTAPAPDATSRTSENIPASSDPKPEETPAPAKAVKKVDFSPDTMPRRSSAAPFPVKTIQMSDLVPETHRFASMWDLGQVVRSA